MRREPTGTRHRVHVRKGGQVGRCAPGVRLPPVRAGRDRGAAMHRCETRRECRRTRSGSPPTPRRPPSPEHRPVPGRAAWDAPHRRAGRRGRWSMPAAAAACRAPTCAMTMTPRRTAVRLGVEAREVCEQRGCIGLGVPLAALPGLARDHHHRDLAAAAHRIVHDVSLRVEPQADRRDRQPAGLRRRDHGARRGGAGERGRRHAGQRLANRRPQAVGPDQGSPGRGRTGAVGRGHARFSSAQIEATSKPVRIAMRGSAAAASSRTRCRSPRCATQ